MSPRTREGGSVCQPLADCMPALVDLDLPHFEDAAIVIDARANEPAWQGAPVIEDWVTYHPEPDREPEVQARVRMLTDEAGFYLSYEVIDPQPERIRARLTRRDGVFGDDLVGVYLDPAGNAQRAYLFFVNAYGVQADLTRLAGEDDVLSWDGQWSSAGRLTEQGFEVEIFIPWRTVRHPRDMDLLGVSLLRITGRTGERSGWPRRDPDVSGILVQENLVPGPGEVDRSLAFQLIPSLTAGWTDAGPDPARWNVNGLAPGLTVRHDPSPALTVLGTLNPDFSQVESDQAQIEVNQRYTLFLSERRPFFQEGREWFDNQFGNLVYTRSMQEPRYGARATVEAGDWQVAALHVLDASPRPSVSEGAGWTEDDTAPGGEQLQALDTVLRARRSVGADGYAGLVYSDKQLVGGAWNRVGGADTRLRLSDGVTAGASLLGSATRFADGRTETGAAGSFELEGRTREDFAGVWGGVQPDDFFAENGFLIYSDWLGGGVWGGRMLYPSSDRVRSVQLSYLSLDAFWRPSDGSFRDLYLSPMVQIRTANATSITAMWFHGTEIYQGATLDYDRAELGVEARPTRWLSAEVEARLGEGPHYETRDVGNLTGVDLGVSLRPTRWLELTQDAGFEQLSQHGDLLYRGLVSRSRLSAYASRELSARLLVDHSSFNELTRGSLLLAWQRNPGTGVFLGGSLSSESEWQAFAKSSWVFQL
jgi:hypothetical protein